MEANISSSESRGLREVIVILDQASLETGV